MIDRLLQHPVTLQKVGQIKALCLGYSDFDRRDIEPGCNIIKFFEFYIQVRPHRIALQNIRTYGVEKAAQRLFFPG